MSIINRFPSGGGGGKKVISGSVAKSQTNTLTITGVDFAPVNIMILACAVYATDGMIGGYINQLNTQIRCYSSTYYDDPEYGTWHILAPNAQVTATYNSTTGTLTLTVNSGGTWKTDYYDYVITN